MRNQLKSIKKSLDDKEREEKQLQANTVVKEAVALAVKDRNVPLLVAELNASSNTKVHHLHRILSFIKSQFDYNKTF